MVKASLHKEPSNVKKENYGRINYNTDYLRLTGVTLAPKIQ